VNLLLDHAQLAVEERLKKLAVYLENEAGVGFFKKIFSEKETSQSLYIHGGVGRGKTMLMKKFYSSIHKTPKVYFHFNSFMRLIHEALRDIRKEEKKYKYELIEAVQRIIKNHKLICFDEFQVVDIADAMLLSRIFSFLFSQGVTVVFTSNSKPLELYKNGLQREVFLEFVTKVLLKNCEVLHLDSPTDYRSLYCRNLTKRYFISNSKNREEVKKIIKNLTAGKKAEAAKIKVWGREIKIKKTFGKIAVINFDEICRVEFGASDFQSICKNFDLIFFLKIPRLSEEEPNEARRLTLFIDEVYENKVALIISAKTAPEKIYEKGTGSEAFHRTISRLNEIKSDQYWKESKTNAEKF
jgi:cell division protein ZapE